MKSSQFRTVMVVEDDQALLEELKILFEAEFENVILAGDGAEAYMRCQNTQFDLIFADIKMPGLTGIELVTRLRSEGNIVPVILASSSSERENLIKAIRLGIHDFVEKPYTPKSLKETLYRNLEILRREKSVAQATTQAGADSPEVKRQKRMLGLLQAVNSTNRNA